MDLQHLPAHLLASILSSHFTLKELAIFDSAITNRCFRKQYLLTFKNEQPSWESIPTVTRENVQPDDKIIHWLNARNLRVKQLMVNTSGGAPTKILQYGHATCVESLHINENNDVKPALFYPNTQLYQAKLLKFLPSVCPRIQHIKYEGEAGPDTYYQLSCQFPGLEKMEFVCRRMERCDEWDQFLAHSRIRSLKISTSFANDAGGIVGDTMKYASRLRSLELVGNDMNMVTPSMMDCIISRCHKLSHLKIGRIPRTRYMLDSLQTMIERARHLESLSLDLDFPISEELIFLITKNMPYLTELRISGEWAEPEVLDVAAEMIAKTYPDLEKLDLGVHPWSVRVPRNTFQSLRNISLQVQPQNIDNVIQLLRRCDQLCEITLHLGLGNASTLLDSFLQLLPYCNRIKSFGRAIPGINRQRLWLIAEYCPSLTNLQLVALEHYEMKDLVYLLAKCIHLQSVDFLYGKQSSAMLQTLRRRFPGVEITVSDRAYDPKTRLF